MTPLDTSEIIFNKHDIRKNLKLPSELTEDLAYICGVLAGDGCLPKSYYIVNCGGNLKDETEYYDVILKILFLNLFGLDVNMRILKPDVLYGFSISSKSLHKFFTETIGLPRGKKDNIEVPPIFLNDRRMMISFIQGLADTDFCLTLKRRYKKYQYYPVVVGVSKSKKLADQVSDFLISEGFSISKNKRSYFDSRYNKLEITYDVTIYGHMQLVKWMQLVGFRHPKHLAKFEIWKDVNSSNKRAEKAFLKMNEKEK